MSEPVMVAVISAVGLVLSGVLVELVRARRRQDAVVHEMKPNHGGSLRDAVNKLSDRFDQLDGKVDNISERLVKVETRTEFIIPNGRRPADG